MYLVRFSYDLLPANREKAVALIRREVDAAKARGLKARLLVPLTRGRGGAALEYEVELSSLDMLDEYRSTAIGSVEETQRWMREFSELLTQPPAVEICVWMKGSDYEGAAMTGADLLVRCLEREGVEYVFGVPGEETLDLNNALADSKIRFIPTRHEQGAAFMAGVYGRLTGRAGVCLATLGPGATNLATGLADANLDRAPVVAITGQASRDRMHKESHQALF
jgi:hypothetical protein